MTLGTRPVALDLDATQRARGIRNLLFVGIATNVCVESFFGWTLNSRPLIDALRGAVAT